MMLFDVMPLAADFRDNNTVACAEEFEAGTDAILPRTDAVGTGFEAVGIIGGRTFVAGVVAE